MAATPAAARHADSPAAVLAAVQAERATADRAEVRILELALDWAGMHELDPSSLFEFERPILLGGAGTPEVSEHCIAELAAALHISTDSGRCLLADALELAHRLPRVTPWGYIVLERGSYLWTSPHGYQFLRDRDGTLDVTPAADRRRTAARGHVHLVPDPQPPRPAPRRARGCWRVGAPALANHRPTSGPDRRMIAPGGTR